MIKGYTVGKKIWAIPEGYIPSGGTVHDDPTLASHETICILNPSDQNAHADLIIYFEDREPAGPFKLKIGARRTLHLGFNDLKEPEVIPRDTAYASMLVSDIPVIVQHTRLDSRQSENALLSTIAYGQD